LNSCLARLVEEVACAEVVTTPSPAPPVVVECWCGLVEQMDRRSLNRFTKDIWARFEERELEPPKWAILRRRRVLARQAWP
jgi:hypothetical protein